MTRRTGAAPLCLMVSATCQAMASPSRSGSVARKTRSAILAALFNSASVFSLPGTVTYVGLKPCSTSMPNPFSGKSRTCPTVARTRYAGPRYLPMVLAFAGDSTMTSDLPAIVAKSSGSSTGLRRVVRRPLPRPRNARGADSATADAPFEGRRVRRDISSAGSFLLSFFALWRVFFEVFLAAMESVYGHVFAAQAIVHVARALHQDAQVVQGDSAIDLAESPLDDMFELHSVEHAGAAHRYEVPPRIGSETAPLMRPEHAKSHWCFTGSENSPPNDAGKSGR